MSAPPVPAPKMSKSVKPTTNTALGFLHVGLGALALILIALKPESVSNTVFPKAYHVATIVGASFMSFALEKGLGTRPDSPYTRLSPLVTISLVGALLSAYLQNRYHYERDNALTARQTLRALILASFDAGVVYGLSNLNLLSGTSPALSMGALNIVMHLLYSSTVSQLYVLNPSEDKSTDTVFLSLTMGIVVLYATLAILPDSGAVDKKAKLLLLGMAMSILAFSNATGLSTPTEADDVFEVESNDSIVWLGTAVGLSALIVLYSAYQARPVVKVAAVAPVPPATQAVRPAS